MRKSSEKHIAYFIGKQFGEWTVIGYSHTDKVGAIYWDAQCSCGEQHKVRAASLRAGTSTRCMKCRPQSASGADNFRWKDTGCSFSQSFITSKRAGAKNRGIEWDITNEALQSILEQQQFKCAYSGEDIGFKGSARNKHTASIDRIDSSKGYVNGNVHWVHKDVNRMKSTLTEERFRELCLKIVKFN